MNSLFVVLVVLVFLLCVPSLVESQIAPQKKSSPKTNITARRVLSFSQLFAEIQACKDTLYTLSNAEVRFNPNTDQRFDGYNPPDSIVIKPHVRLNDIEFTGISWVHLDRVHFKKELFLEDCSFQESLQIINATFDGYFLLGNITAPELVDFEGCVFRNSITVGTTSKHTIGTLAFSDCSFSGELPRKARWVVHPTGYEFLPLVISRTTMKDTELRIQRCSFLNPSNQGKIVINSEFRSLRITDNTFDTDVILRGSTINYAVIMQENKFNRTLDMTLFKHPGTNTVCEWSEIAGKLIGSREISDDDRYEAKSDSEMVNIYAYHRLLASYNDLYTIYKTRGDRESANGCYVAIKTIETRRAAYLHRTTPTLETWFDWRLNQLLEVFSDYGTNAAKGLLYIFYVIICFAALYLVFPSEPDNLRRDRVVRAFHLVIGYFSTTSSLVHLSDHTRRRALDDLHNFHATLAVSQHDVPSVIKWLGTPLYAVNKTFVRFSTWLVERFDIVPGRWNELPARRKVWTAFACGTYLVGFLLWGVVMRVVNAFALSLNAFVTLGYGEIQARGVARYLAVLEGAIGWLLLTIFSVTLISQLLQ